MNIYVYWNTKDKDCKKIFHFVSSEDKFSIVECLEQGNRLSINRICQHFDDKTQILENICKNDLIIFLTHGVEDCILKYRNDPDRALQDFVLLDKSNAHILKGKIILAFCCSSAREFGRYCVSSDIGCKAYVGFERDIVYDNGKAKRSRGLIYESYKIAFMKSIKYALKSKCSIEEYQIKLLQFLRKEAARVILESGNHTLHNMYSGTIEGLVALGDVKAKVFP